MKSYFHTETNTINSFDINIPKNVKPLNVVSLFSGTGGMDLGFKGDFDYLGTHYGSQPYKVVFANDIFKQAADVYEANFKNNVERRSIVDLDVNELPDENVDVILGGFPCQSFSLAGNRNGLNDPRGQMYLQMIRVINHYQPKMFIAENVDGIRNSKKDNKGKAVDISALDTILEAFDLAGYNVQYRVLNSADYGVPQARRRVIIIGLRKDLGQVEDVFYPEKMFDKTGETTGKKWLSSKQGIDDLWDKINNPNVLNHTQKDFSKAKFYPGKKTQGNNRIVADRPAPTIRAEHHGNIEAHYRTNLEDENDMNGWRRLSVRETARLQSFPDLFNFTCSASAAYKMIGNAVPPVMAWNIARSIFYTLYKLDEISLKDDQDIEK